MQSILFIIARTMLQLLIDQRMYLYFFYGSSNVQYDIYIIESCCNSYAQYSDRKHVSGICLDGEFPSESALVSISSNNQQSRVCAYIDYYKSLTFIEHICIYITLGFLVPALVQLWKTSLFYIVGCREAQLLHVIGKDIHYVQCVHVQYSIRSPDKHYHQIFS